MTETKPTLKALTERVDELTLEVATLKAENMARKNEVDRMLLFVTKQTNTMQQLTDIVTGRK